MHRRSRHVCDLFALVTPCGINQMEQEMCSYLECQLDIDCSMLRNFQHRPQQDFIGSGPHPPMVLPQPAAMPFTFMLSKFFYDNMYSNKSSCIVGQDMFTLITLWGINQMERECAPTWSPSSTSIVLCYAIFITGSGPHPPMVLPQPAATPFTFTLSLKFFYDDMYSNKSSCIVGQDMFTLVTLRGINQMERECAPTWSPSSTSIILCYAISITGSGPHPPMVLPQPAATPFTCQNSCNASSSSGSAMPLLASRSPPSTSIPAYPSFPPDTLRPRTRLQPHFFSKRWGATSSVNVVPPGATVACR